MQTDTSNPTRQTGSLTRLRFVIGLFTMVALLGVIAVELFAWLLPQRFENEGTIYVRLATFSFFIRVFQLYIGVGTLMLAGLLLASRWQRWAVGGVLMGATLLLPYARDFAPKRPPVATSASVRLMSINLFFMNRDEDAIMRSIEAANPDVITLVEVTEWSMVNVIRKHLIGPYQYVTQPSAEGAAIVLSRIPFKVGPAAATPRGSFGRMPVVLEIGGRDVALYGVHLVSPGRAWLVEKNRKQVGVFTAIIRSEKRPVIIAGDCNFSQLTPNAAALHREGMRSSQELVGFGLGNTWWPRWWPSLSWLPGVRIDHIWLSPQLTATSHSVGLDTGSDHRPVIADIAIAAPP